MAILEGASVLTIVVGRSHDRAARRSLRDLENDVSAAVTVRLAAARHPPTVAPVARVRVIPRAQDRHQSEQTATVARDRPTHELTLRVVEQPWVVAKVARVLAAADVNITWFVSHVLAPVLGERWPRCAVKMHLHFPSGSAGEFDKVTALLRTLAEREGWEHIAIREWSVGALSDRQALARPGSQDR